MTLALPNDQDATGRSLGDEELALLREVIASGTLTSTKGRVVKELERTFAEQLGLPHAVACSSGTAAIHTALAALNPNPGDEVITTPITDMGALTPILYQGAIPVFADVDPATLNVTAATLRARLSDRTKAIIVTHLFGNPCRMDEIAALAREKGIPVIEDCAQAFLARSRGGLVGTFGTIACFSFQQGKHMTSGEGGIVACKDPALARRMYLFVNKGWGYGDANPDHEFLALNYRMSELLGAVALAQFRKLGDAVKSRVAAARRLSERLARVPGVRVPGVDSRDTHAYWRYALFVDSSKIKEGAPGLAVRLAKLGVVSQPRYIKKPAFECRVFQKRRTFGESHFPFDLARPEALDWSRERFPGTYEGLEHVLVMPWNERYTAQHVDFIAGAVEEAASDLISKG
ncbi:MAG: DegT/DnrJ/EryC1/StrS family aminotransferase [Candidatus Wallbacteria bacterium]|nr:DegT/DnrJ/EryC1/StrS family aminotransferase [Candidatus Wallbacteria bacterium]